MRLYTWVLAIPLCTFSVLPVNSLSSISSLYWSLSLTAWPPCDATYFSLALICTPFKVIHINFYLLSSTLHFLVQDLIHTSPSLPMFPLIINFIHISYSYHPSIHLFWQPKLSLFPNRYYNHPFSLYSSTMMTSLWSSVTSLFFHAITLHTHRIPSTFLSIFFYLCCYTICIRSLSCLKLFYLFFLFSKSMFRSWNWTKLMDKSFNTESVNDWHTTR